MPVRRIDVAAWALTIGGCRAPALEMRRVSFGEALGLLLPLGPGLGLDVELHGRQRLQHCVDHADSDRLSSNVLTDRPMILLPPGVPEGAGAPLLLPHTHQAKQTVGKHLWHDVVATANIVLQRGASP
jgi:hypothetical protein